MLKRDYREYAVPVPLDTFVAYGLWFQQDLALDVEEALVTRVSATSDRYDLELESGVVLRARKVVIATGVEHFSVVPAELAPLPPSLSTHSSVHESLAGFTGQRVVVVGGGKSALESAALLHEIGADVHLVARQPRLAWSGPPLPADRGPLQRLREPRSGVGSGWGTWFYSRHPELFRHLPTTSRILRSRRALGPAGASWLLARVEGRVSLHLGQRVTDATACGDRVRLGLGGRGGQRGELRADHVIEATGYESDLGRLNFLDDSLRTRIRTTAKSPAVDGSYQSSAGGLYFVGSAVAASFGSVMRFVYGTEHAARTVSRSLLSDSRRYPRPIKASR